MDLWAIYIAGIVKKDEKYLVIRENRNEPYALNKLVYVCEKLFNNFEVEGCFNEEKLIFFDVLQKNIRKKVFDKTGILVDEKMRLINNHIFKKANGENICVIVFLCRYLGEKSIKIDKSEISEVLWMTEDEILSSEMDEKLKEVYRIAFGLKDSVSVVNKVDKQDIIQEMPKTAKKVFSGVIFDVYQWEQRLFDGSIAIFEKIKRQDTVEAICATPDKKIIIIEDLQPRKRTRIGFPGGRIESGEDPEEAVRREIMEETGYAIDDKSLFLWKKINPFSKIDWTIYVFIARNVKKVSKKILDSGEKIKVRKLDFEEFLLLPEKENFFDHEIGRELFLARIYRGKKDKLKSLIFGE